MFYGLAPSDDVSGEMPDLAGIIPAGPASR